MTRARIILAAGAVAVAAVTAVLVWPSGPHYQPRSLHVVAPSVAPSFATSPGVAPATARYIPQRVIVPSVGLSVAVMPLGKNPDNTLAVPPLTGPAAYEAGWYDLGAAPGQLGNAIFDGHINSAAAGDLAFGKLLETQNGQEVPAVSKGDTIEVRTSGPVEWFRVTDIQVVLKTQFPTMAVYAPKSVAGVVLITCAGTFDPGKGSYDSNLIVYGTAIPPPAS